MRAAVLERYGTDGLLVREIADPAPGNGDALIRIRAAALNQVDLYMREGGKGISHQLPMILGVEGVGEVVTAPEGSGLTPGQRVALYPATFCGRCRDCLRGEQPFCERVRYLGEHRDGTFAELVALPAACCVPIANALDDVTAAVLPVAYLTAWRMLFGKGEPIGPGDTALVVGAGGGVASAAIQLARLAGARVLATTSAAKRAHAEALGAELVIDHDAEDVPKRVLEATAGAGADVVIDNVGAATWSRSLRSVRRGGRVVTCGATTGGDPSAELQRLFIRQIAVYGSTLGSLEEFRRVIAAATSGALHPAIDREVDLTEAPRALAYLSTGQQRGKIVVRVC